MGIDRKVYRNKQNTNRNSGIKKRPRCARIPATRVATAFFFPLTVQPGRGQFQRSKKREQIFASAFRINQSFFLHEKWRREWFTRVHYFSSSTSKLQLKSWFLNILNWSFLPCIGLFFNLKNFMSSFKKYFQVGREIETMKSTLREVWHKKGFIGSIYLWTMLTNERGKNWDVNVGRSALMYLPDQIMLITNTRTLKCERCHKCNF